jgi:hypothetical protein
MTLHLIDTPLDRLTMSLSSSTSTGPIHLRIDQRVVLSGSSVSGHVRIDMPGAERDGIRSVVVRLRGVTQTYALSCL